MECSTGGLRRHSRTLRDPQRDRRPRPSRPSRRRRVVRRLPLRSTGHVSEPRWRHAWDKNVHEPSQQHRPAERHRLSRQAQMTTRRRCRALGAASDLVEAGLTDERNNYKQQGARLATARGHSMPCAPVAYQRGERILFDAVPPSPVRNVAADHRKSATGSSGTPPDRARSREVLRGIGAPSAEPVMPAS
jgi:hypothetical protein